MMPPEKQEAFEIEMAQRQARLFLQNKQKADVLGKRAEKGPQEKMEGDRVSVEIVVEESSRIKKALDLNGESSVPAP